ncbi:HEPN domain-containing protein [candidate division WOR-3 bacterium]|nr:HEPN domain-containing protein [candidate division WOR-3 bacterium]
MKQNPFHLWQNKAEKDLLSAEKEFASENPITETVCFHSEQAVEKYIKAYLVKNEK